MLLSPTLSAYILLALAIIAEVIGSSYLVQSNGFSKPIPTAITVVCFIIAFFLLSQVVKTIPLGIAYAIWSGVGIILTASVSYFLFNTRLDTPAVLGMALIIVGVIIINLFSKTTTY